MMREHRHGNPRELFQECWRSSLLCIRILTFLGNSGNEINCKTLIVRLEFHWNVISYPEASWSSKSYTVCLLPWQKSISNCKKVDLHSSKVTAWTSIRALKLLFCLLSPKGSCFLACTVPVPVPTKSINQLILGGCGVQCFAFQLKEAWRRVQWVLEPRWKRDRAALLGRSKAVSFGNSYLISSAAPKQQSKLHSLKLGVQNQGWFLCNLTLASSWGRPPITLGCLFQWVV